jgi:hypothetical protein
MIGRANRTRVLSSIRVFLTVEPVPDDCRGDAESVSNRLAAFAGLCGSIRLPYQDYTPLAE